MLGRTFPLLRPGIGKENRHDGQYSDRGKVDRRRQIGILHQVEEEQGCQYKMETSHDEPKALDVIHLLLLRGRRVVTGYEPITFTPKISYPNENEDYCEKDEPPNHIKSVLSNTNKGNNPFCHLFRVVNQELPVVHSGEHFKVSIWVDGA